MMCRLVFVLKIALFHEMRMLSSSREAWRVDGRGRRTSGPQEHLNGNGLPPQTRARTASPTILAPRKGSSHTAPAGAPSPPHAVPGGQIIRLALRRPLGVLVQVLLLRAKPVGRRQRWRYEVAEFPRRRCTALAPSLLLRSAEVKAQFRRGTLQTGVFFPHGRQGRRAPF